jgi:FkbM family methyltransferase
MIYEQIINEGDLIFDVGLNVGDKSEIFLSLGAKVVGFEPQIECFYFATNKIGNNPNFKAENIALDKKKGSEKIYIASYHTISSMSEKFIIESKKERFPEYQWSNERLVQVDTLDNMIEKYGKPEYIKIDVEGYEFNVISGLSTPINLISIEFNAELCDETVKCIEYIDKLNNNETEFNYQYRVDENLKFDKWLSKNEILSYLTSVNDFKFEFGDVFCKIKK